MTPVLLVSGITDSAGVSGVAAVTACKLLCGLDVIVDAGNDANVVAEIDIFDVLTADVSAADEHDAVLLLCFHIFFSCRTIEI